MAEQDETACHLFPNLAAQKPREDGQPIELLEGSLVCDLL